ncbi:transcriptional regulator with XRE-family HTH domain [Lysobacter niastensis]|uniref:Transcriptional regulator with XRE-family HTH domain n=1 Tax=Lysobacter niastensis TaxID=380629 RepID=A0ABU1WAJ3_9GAMM|nr:helix-turn-helix transcriptional regulator [Lysobacter niastensis]MDR7134630.1 transcriptional regulator with XRE-family HTH domain [Lysobacter niastensis]
MSYAAKLIEQAQNAHGYTLTELALALGVKHPTISQWKSGRGSPMSEDRVIELCKIAGIKDYAPWLIGVHAEHLKNRDARSSLEKLAKQLGAAAVLAFAVFTPLLSKAAPVNLNGSTPYALCEIIDRGFMAASVS